MDRERWERVQALFHAAVERPAAEHRAYVEAEAGADTALAADVLALLDQDARGDSLLQRSIDQIAGEALAGDLDPPRDLGPYRLRERLGEGGMGVVFLADRTDLGSQVAIKFLRDAWLSPARRALFAREQRSLARLNHPSIARLYDADALVDGTPWFAMEYVDGLPLTQWCREHRSTVRQRVTLFRAVCEAVLHAHQQAVLHRDLKPSNILVTRGGQPKLLDFGIAKPLDVGPAGADGTRTVLRAFTPAYAAPEQFRGEGLGVHSDLYSLGAVLYELLAGRPPIDVADCGTVEAERRVAEQVPDRPSVALRRAATTSPEAHGRLHEHGVEWPDLDVLCTKALQKDPSRRYASVDALLRDLDHWLRGEPLDARPDSLAYRTGKFVRRHRAAVASVAAGVVVVTALVTYYTANLARARDAALAEAERTRRIQSFVNGLFVGGGDEDAAPPDTLRVLTLLARGEQEAGALDAEPAIQAELFQTLGGIYQALGQLERADTLLQRALAERRTELGPNHADVAQSLVALGLLRMDQSRLEEADSLVRLGLALHARDRARDPATTARFTRSLGRVLVGKGDYDEGARVLTRTTELDSLARVPLADVGTTLTELANCHFYAGRYDVADSLNRRVLALDRSLFGARHPRVAGDLFNLGAVRQEMGQWEAAEGYYRQALEIYRGWYGENHFETAACLNAVGRVLVQEGRLAEAHQLLERALAARERIYGPVHPNVASTLNEIGLLAQSEGRFDDAIAALTRMHRIYEQVYGGRHYLIGLALANLGSVFTGRGDHRAAEPYYRRALAEYLEVLPADHLYVGVARLKLGRSLMRQSRWAEGERETRVGYGVLMKQAEPPFAFLQNGRRDLMRAYAALGHPGESERFRRESEQAAADSARDAARDE